VKRGKTVSAVCRLRINNEVIALFFVLMLSYSFLCYVSSVKTVAAGMIRTVRDDGSADFSSLQQAINNAEDGDTIIVGPGTYYEHLVVNKSLSIIGVDQSSTVIDGGNTWMTIVIEADNVTLKNFTIQHGMVGVVLEEEKEGNMLLENKIVFNSYYGIYGDRCGKNVIANNNVSFNRGHGIFLYGSQPCVLDGNFVLSNGVDGMFIRYSSNSTVKGNFVSGNRDCGIYIYSDEDPERPSGLSINNGIRENLVLNNSCGIRVCHFGTDKSPSKNEICENLIAYNNIGLNVSGSSSNSIYNNNFVSNSKQLSIFESFNNTWDGGYYVGGNYWSDYNSSDLYWGPSQNEVGSDGIIDVPYLASEDSAEEDKYPFVHENGWRVVPELRIISPANGTFRMSTLPLVFTINKPVRVSYSLDNQPNVTVVGKLMLMDLQVGVHNITVYADDVLGNEVSSEVAFVITFFVDLNFDGIVNIVDISRVAYSFGCSYGSERWNQDSDLDSDGLINIVDIAMVARGFGKTIWE